MGHWKLDTTHDGLMNTIATLPLSAALLLSPLSSINAAESTPARDVKKVLEKFRAVRPGARELRLFELDWVPTLAAAQKRAAREGRPVLLLVVRNSEGNLRSGHC